MDITCAYQVGDRMLGLQTDQRSRRLQPLQIAFQSDAEMEEWHADIVNGTDFLLASHSDKPCNET